MPLLAHPIDYNALDYQRIPVSVYEKSAYDNLPDDYLQDALANPEPIISYADELTKPDIDTDLYHRNFAAIGTPEGPAHQVLVDPETGTQLKAYLLNGDTAPEGSEETVAIPTWLSSPSTNPGNQALYSLLAAKDPTRRFWVVDTPGLGQSDTLPADTLDRLAESGSFMESGKIVARALQSAEIKPNRLIGNSSGARFIAGAASALGKNTLKRLDIVDPPYEKVGRIALAFFVKEPKHRTKAREVSTDEFQHAPQNEYRVKDFGIKGLLGLVLGSKTRHQKVSEGKAFGRGIQGLEVDLQAALDVHEELALSIVSPSASEVSPRLGQVRSMLGRLVVRSASQSVRQMEIPNATHAMDDHHPSVFVAAVNHPHRTQ